MLASAPSQEEAVALEAQSSEEANIDNRNLAKLKTFYDTCIDTTTQDEMGSRQMMVLIQHARGLLFGDDSAHLAEELRALSPSSAVAQQHPTGPLTPPPGATTPVPPNQIPLRAPQPHPPTDKPGPPPPRNGRQKALTSVLSWAHAHAIPAFWGINVDGDPVEDPTEGTIWVTTGGLGFPDKAYYEDKDEIKFYNEVIEATLAAVAREDKHKKTGAGADMAFSGNSKKHRSLARKVVAFEREISRATPDGDVLADPLSIYNPIPVNKLAYTSNAVDWPMYLSALTVKVPHNVLVHSPDFLRKIGELVSQTSDEVLEAYLIWTIVRTYGLNLGPKASLRAPAEALDRRLKGVAFDAKEDRATVCLNALNEALGFMAGRYYVQQAFPPAARNKVIDIIDSIISAFKDRLPELDWLDPKTRRAAEVKADNIRIKVGYPEYPNTTSAASIEAYYSEIDIKKFEYFGNRFRSATVLNKKNLAQAGRVLNVLRWDMFPAEVNAYYNPGGNEIAFPAGILQPPYFDVATPDYIQYGALGSVAGHELTHSVDPAGRLYDEHGYLRDWWTNDTTIEFYKRQQCLMDQYGNYTLDDGTGRMLPLNPKLTIGEDVADGGGVAQSYRAWQTLLEKDTKEIRARNRLLPGLEQYSREQLFFISYGIAYARNLRPQEALKRIRTDPHSPNPFRVNGVVTNSPAFYKAFGCKAGDKMFTPVEDRCYIW